MTAYFDTTAKIGDSIVAIQGDFRILGTVTQHDFKPGPGNYSALSIVPDAVLSGSLPTGLDQLVLNSNHWDLYRANSEEIPPLGESREYDRLIEALTILRTVLREHGGQKWLSAEHDVIYSDIDPKHFSEDQLQRLSELGWIGDIGDRNFYHFV